jgi:uncharacterized lipoprotein YmbA
MKSPSIVIVATTAVLLAGCLLKPTTVKTQSFVLTPIAPETAPAPNPLAIGVGQVKLAPYLLRTSVAIRHGTNEINYLEGALWAERLDHAFQHTLAANLAALLPTDQVRLSLWPPSQVALAVHVSLEQFDVDRQGHGSLVAWWRITSPSGDKVLKSGSSRLRRDGPPPVPHAESVPATLSALTADFSRVLATAIRESAPPAVQ